MIIYRRVELKGKQKVFASRSKVLFSSRVDCFLPCLGIVRPFRFRVTLYVVLLLHWKWGIGEARGVWEPRSSAGLSLGSQYSSAPVRVDLDGKVAFRKKVKMPSVPTATLYVLKAFVGAGTELPRFTDINLIGTRKM